MMIPQQLNEHAHTAHNTTCRTRSLSFIPNIAGLSYFPIVAFVGVLELLLSAVTTKLTPYTARTAA